ncbi:MAG: methyltransferase domain-containing protein [Pseudomonadota bacterium]
MSSDVIPVFARFFGSWHVSVGRRAFRARDLQAHYDKQSGVWQSKIDRYGFEAAYADLISRVLCHWRYRVVAREPRVLDAGVGTGAMAAAFAKQLGRPFRLVGVDLSSEMLARVRDRFARSSVQVDLLQADLAALPFADQKFDVVLVAHVLEHLSAPDRVLAELYRVLKPGGVVIACITRRSWMGLMVQMLWRTHRVDIGLAERWLRGAGFVQVRAMSLDKDQAARRWSIGYVARKVGDV